ncbi:MAG: signaling protein, partial [Victivallales bacterium]|nr:signaling protein [Victivallales bacterium]
RVTTSPGTANEPLGVLSDGKLAENYGPVFRNGVVGGTYKVDLGRDLPVSAVGSWSFRQGGVRGRQRFALFGINGQKPKERVPLAMVDTVAGPDGIFVATRVQVSDGGVLGSFRWLEWVTQPVTGRKENTAFQEFQVR